MPLFNDAGEFTGLMGWAHEQEDREFLHEKGKEFDLFGAFTAPEQIDPRGWLTIRNQGAPPPGEGSCAGHAMACGCRVLNWIGTQGDEIDLSPQFAYRVGQMCAGIRGDRGCTISGVIQGGIKYGVLLEELLPYSGSYDLEPTRENFDSAHDHLLKNFTPLYSYDDVFQWLASGVGVVIVGIQWTESMARHKGPEPIEEMSGRVVGGHAQCWPGYTRRKGSKDRKYIVDINSWGEEWGDRGTAEFSPDVVDQICADKSCEVIGVSDLATYRAGRASWIMSNPLLHRFKF